MPTTVRTDGILFSDSTLQTFASGVKSVQSIFAYPKGSLTGDYGSSRAVNITISSVDVSKSFILYPHNTRLNSGSGTVYAVTAKFINSTTVQLCPLTTDTNITSLRFQVIEFK